MEIQSKKGSVRGKLQSRVSKPSVRKRKKLSLPFHISPQFNDTIHPYTLPARSPFISLLIGKRIRTVSSSIPKITEFVRFVSKHLYPTLSLESVYESQCCHLAGYSMIPSDRNRKGRMGGVDLRDAGNMTGPIHFQRHVITPSRDTLLLLNRSEIPSSSP